MKLTLMLLVLLWEKVDLTLTQQECLKLPTVEHGFVSDQYKKAEYQEGDVIYFSCDPGYTTGLNTTYVCTEHGWRAATLGQCIENTFPVALGCTRPPPLKNGYVLENSTYFYENGQRVGFRCNNLYTMNGRPHKTCTNGQWTGDLQCLVNFCEKPESDHFKVNRDKVMYREGEVLRYSCNRGYRKVDGRPSVCRKQGLSPQWTPMPLCELITCKLNFNPPKGTTYNPQNQIIFNPGQSVRVLCGEKQWVKSKELQSAELTCQDTGRWDFTPACQRVTCSKIGENVYRWEYTWYNTVEMDRMLWYRCYADYEKTSPTARCTRRGWEPDPLCKEKTCIQPSYKNADITDDPKEQYHQNERVYFKCTYDPATTFSITCYDGNWTSGRTCKEKPCTTQPIIKNGQMYFRPRETYAHGKHVLFRCIGETETFTVSCQAGEWKTEKVCEDVACTKAPVITNAEMVSHRKRTYPPGQTVEFRCTTGQRELFTVSCQSGEWKYKHRCLECGSTDIPNGFSHLSNNKLYYTCSEGYKLLTKGWWGEASCVGGKWNTQECVASTDCGPVPDIPHLIVSSESTRFSEGDTFPIRCEAGHQNLNPDLQELTCKNGTWNLKGVEFKQICTPIEKKCRSPPEVKNAVVMAQFEKEYLSNTTLTYKCRDHFIMEGDGTIQCNNGTWEQKDISCKATHQPQ